MMSNVNKEIKNFAPVIIPTLNRYEHFKNCIESLMACTHSDKTDVFIGLDYPSKSEHWEGYNKINSYLEKLENKNPFAKLTVLRRDHNLGLGKNGNIDKLIEEVLKLYDNYIITEDDNIFSKAFLDYINKGLERFKDDKSVLAISGYKHNYNIKFNKNTFIRQNSDFNAWGYGTWKDRYLKFKILDKKWFRKKLNIKNINFIKQSYGNQRVAHLFKFAINKSKSLPVTDIMLTLYLILENQYVITPFISMVRNLGFDGSGQNFKNLPQEIKDTFIKQPIYENISFTYKGSGFEYETLNKEIYKNENPLQIKNITLIKIIIKQFIKEYFFK